MKGYFKKASKCLAGFSCEFFSSLFMTFESIRHLQYDRIDFLDDLCCEFCLFHKMRFWMKDFEEFYLKICEICHLKELKMNLANGKMPQDR